MWSHHISLTHCDQKQIRNWKPASSEVLWHQLHHKVSSLHFKAKLLGAAGEPSSVCLLRLRHCETSMPEILTSLKKTSGSDTRRYKRLHTFWGWWVLALGCSGIPLPRVPAREGNPAVPASSPPDSHPGCTYRHKDTRAGWGTDAERRHGACRVNQSTHMSPRYCGLCRTPSASWDSISSEKSLATAALWNTSCTMVPFSICLEPPSKLCVSEQQVCVINAPTINKPKTTEKNEASSTSVFDSTFFTIIKTAHHESVWSLQNNPVKS